MSSYPVKESLIGSAVSEIIRYTQTDSQTNRQTDKHTSCYFIIRIILEEHQGKFNPHTWHTYPKIVIFYQGQRIMHLEKKSILDIFVQPEKELLLCFPIFWSSNKSTLNQIITNQIYSIFVHCRVQKIKIHKKKLYILNITHIILCIKTVKFLVSSLVTFNVLKKQHDTRQR